MTKRFPPASPVGTPMLACRPSRSARDLLALRRSASKHHLTSPGPSSDEIDQLLQIASRVPDHRRLSPWRFIVLEGDARFEFGQAISAIHDANTPGAEERDIMEAAALPMRAPVVIAVISSPDPHHKTPVWEQELSAGAVCLNLLLAANASGWAGVWLTEWIAYDTKVDKLLGLTKAEKVAGFIYLGTSTILPPERARSDVRELVQRWTGPTS